MPLISVDPQDKEDDTKLYETYPLFKLPDRPPKQWNELSEWEKMKFTVRILKEMFGLSEAKLEHTYLGDDTPYDSGMFNFKQWKEEEEARKKAKPKERQAISTAKVKTPKVKVKQLNMFESKE
jgi:hypothetical protein